MNQDVKRSFFAAEECDACRSLERARPRSGPRPLHSSSQHDNRFLLYVNTKYARKQQKTPF